MDRAEAAGLGVSVAGHVALLALLSAALVDREPGAGHAAGDGGLVRRRGRARCGRAAALAAPGGRAARRPTAPGRPRARSGRRSGAARAGAAPCRARVADRPRRQPAPPRRRRRRAGPPPRATSIRASFGRDPAARPSGPPAAVMSARAAADIASAISRQVQPCADRQVYPGPGSERIVTPIMLSLDRDGSLKGRPRVGRQRGIDDENRALRPARRRPRGQRLRLVRAAARPAAGAVRRAARLEQFHHELSFARMRMSTVRFPVARRRRCCPSRRGFRPDRAAAGQRPGPARRRRHRRPARGAADRRPHHADAAGGGDRGGRHRRAGPPGRRYRRRRSAQFRPVHADRAGRAARGLASRR